MSEVPITKAESNAYLEGWRTCHIRGVRITDYQRGLLDAWMRGWDDCERGVIDADWCLGPDKRPHGATRKEP